MISLPPGWRRAIRAAIDEDVALGDVTTSSVVPDRADGRATIVAKADAVVCGQPFSAYVFDDVAERLGVECAYQATVSDGSRVSSGQELAVVHGGLQALLTAERVALNFLMKLSGISTRTRVHVDAAGPGGPMIVDTRKTTPSFRGFEKYAVRVGGGRNHRFGLGDGVMIKDNHIAAAGGIACAVQRARAHAHHLLRIQVEVTTLDELDQALKSDVDAVLLDNMTDAELAQASQRARDARDCVIVEASGNMTPQRIEALKHMELDVISVGGLIHQATWTDLSMRVDRAP